MLTKIETDLDFIIAKSRALHSFMYEGDRLTSLLRHRTIAELANELFPGEVIPGHMALQRRLVERFAGAVAQVWRYVKPPRDRLFAALVARLQIENMKLWLRVKVSGLAKPPEQLPEIAVPEPFRWLQFEPSQLNSVGELVEGIPERLIRESTRQALAMFNESGLPVYLEAGLDRGYFRLLGDAYRALGRADRVALADLAEAETTLYNLMFILRGRVNHNLEPGVIAGLAAPQLATGRVASWIAPAARAGTTREIIAAAPRGIRDRLAEAPAELPAIERRLWRRYYALANRAYFASQFDVG
ncbi:MAG: hypothetical protein GWP05_09005, partial [Anaerolineaceae bacterium]|nr:hypothetical protein [Anaerolineaceae bacterium]